MASVSLHRASRILLAIDTSLKLNEPKTSANLSVFSDSPIRDLKKLQNDVVDAVEMVERLLTIRGRIRSARDSANTMSGVTRLLNRKSSCDDLLKVLARIPGVVPAPKADDEEDIYRRRPKKPAVPNTLDVSAVQAHIAAARDRFTASDAAVTAEIECSTVDQETSARCIELAVQTRRETDDIYDQTQALNAQTMVEIDDESLDWLRTHKVL